MSVCPICAGIFGFTDLSPSGWAVERSGSIRPRARVRTGDAHPKFGTKPWFHPFQMGIPAPIYVALSPLLAVVEELNSEYSPVEAGLAFHSIDFRQVSLALRLMLRVSPSFWHILPYPPTIVVNVNCYEIRKKF